jgi:hypothetical protein
MRRIPLKPDYDAIVDDDAPLDTPRGLTAEDIDSIGWAMGEARKADREYCEKLLKQLELQIAQLRGAIDVLRGKGAPGSFNVRGTFDSDAVYNHLDVVALNGSSFVATRDSPGDCPGDGWQLLASAGSRGPRGGRGGRGEKGERGDDAPVWGDISFDPQKMSVTLRDSNGTRGPTFSLDQFFCEFGLDPATYSIAVRTIDGTEMQFSLWPLFERFYSYLEGRKR